MIIYRKLFLLAFVWLCCGCKYAMSTQDAKMFISEKKVSLGAILTGGDCDDELGSRLEITFRLVNDFLSENYKESEIPYIHISLLEDFFFRQNPNKNMYFLGYESFTAWDYRKGYDDPGELRNGLVLRISQSYKNEDVLRLIQFGIEQKQRILAIQKIVEIKPDSAVAEIMKAAYGKETLTVTSVSSDTILKIINDPVKLSDDLNKKRYFLLTSSWESKVAKPVSVPLQLSYYYSEGLYHLYIVPYDLETDPWVVLSADRFIEIKGSNNNWVVFTNDSTFYVVRVDRDDQWTRRGPYTYNWQDSLSILRSPVWKVYEDDRANILIKFCQFYMDEPAKTILVDLKADTAITDFSLKYDSFLTSLYPDKNKEAVEDKGNWQPSPFWLYMIIALFVGIIAGFLLRKQRRKQ
jgi:hypothetical protein